MIQVIKIRDHILVDFDVKEFERAVEEFVSSYSNNSFQVKENTISFVYEAPKLLTPIVEEDKIVFEEAIFNVIFKIGNKEVTLEVNIDEDTYDIDDIENISDYITDRIKAYKESFLALYNEVIEAYANRATVFYNTILKPKEK